MAMFHNVAMFFLSLTFLSHRQKLRSHKICLAQGEMLHFLPKKERVQFTHSTFNLGSICYFR